MDPRVPSGRRSPQYRPGHRCENAETALERSQKACGVVLAQSLTVAMSSFICAMGI